MTNPTLSGYCLVIHEATGRTNPRELAKIEDLMRHVIFHSTLDWQTRAQLHRGAREAVEVMDEAARLGIAI